MLLHCLSFDYIFQAFLFFTFVALHVLLIFLIFLFQMHFVLSFIFCYNLLLSVAFELLPFFFLHFIFFILLLFSLMWQNLSNLTITFKFLFFIAEESLSFNRESIKLGEILKSAQKVVNLFFLMKVDTKRAQILHAAQGVNSSLQTINRVAVQIEVNDL